MKRVLACSVLLFAAMAIGSAAAHALTIENNPGTGGAGAKNYIDPDEQAPIQKLTDPRTGRGGGYNFSSPNFSFSITREPADRSPSLFGPRRGYDNRPGFGFGPNGTGSR